MKYILFLFLCGVGCVFNMSGMGPGLVSMSPLRRSIRCSESFLFCGMFFLFLCALFMFILLFMRIRVICCVSVLCVCVVLFGYFLVFIWFFCFLVILWENTAGLGIIR